MTSPVTAFAVKTSTRATPERIWDLITDAAGYVRWNNTVHKADGKVAPGERVTSNDQAGLCATWPNGPDRRHDSVTTPQAMGPRY